MQGAKRNSRGIKKSGVIKTYKEKKEQKKRAGESGCKIGH